uniref:Coat protein n=1 Tax=Pelargonium zonate spot virus TaxID=116056 RepID=A0A224ATL1_PZSV|nr:coat protein [Pelargonium zonate spot virus]
MPPKRQNTETRKARQNRARRSRQQALAKLARDFSGLSMAVERSPSTSWADIAESESRLKLIPGFTATEVTFDPLLAFGTHTGFATAERSLTVPDALLESPNLRLNRVAVVVLLDPTVPEAHKFWCALGDRWVVPSVGTFPSNAVRITGREGKGHVIYHYPGKTVEHLAKLRVYLFATDFAIVGNNSPVATVKIFVEHEKIGQAEYIPL